MNQNGHSPARPMRQILDEEDGWISLLPGQSVQRARDQVRSAQEKLRRPASSYVRWPFKDLDELTGPLGAGGKIWIAAAFSGSGKTTFVTSVIEQLRHEGKRIYAMPLETQGEDFRTYLAALAAGVYPGDVLSGNLHQDRDATAKFELVEQALATQTERPYVDQVMVSDLSAIDLDGLEYGFKEAKAFGADLVIVDHMDHVAGGNGNDRAADSQRVCRGALEMVKANGLTVLFTSQLNLDAARGSDRLAKYGPPRVEHLWFPGVKLQIASGIIGLHRRLRGRKAGESEEEYAALVADARKGKVPPSEVLDHHAMGVNAMKLRDYGSREGQWTYLAFERGRVASMREADKYTTSVLSR